jgi:predicted small metal-binding protein
MIKQLFAVLIVLALSLSTLALAQDKAQKELPKKSDKAELAKEEATAGPLKSVSCDPKCGFMVRSHNEKELLSVVKAHAKKMHNMTMTDKQVKEMMKTEEAADKKE